MTTRLQAIVAFALGVALAAACKHDDPNHCPGAPFDNCMNLTCVTNNDCSAPTPVCDVDGAKTCVECLAPDQASACNGTTPVCGEDHTCRGCSIHGECPASDVCLPDGRCAEPDEVAYVQAGGTGAQPCAKGAPCGTLQEGVTAVTTDRPYIKISGTGTLADSATTTIDGKAVTILADPGAKLDRTGDGPILLVRSNNANVSIYDLEITGQTGLADAAIQLEPNGGAPMLALVRVKIMGSQGRGISTNGGTLTVSRCTLSGNQGGGILVGAGVVFDIVNNYIVRNGDPDNGTFGGLNLGVAVAGSNRLEFNTIVDNRAAINSGGVVCNVPTLSASNNIIARNSLGMSTTAPDAQEAGACMYPSSKIQSDVAGLAFVDAEVPAPFDYRLTAASSAIDQAVTPSNVDVDNDGDPRPQGAQKDIGADELQP